MAFKIKLVAFLTIFLWASAFVGIRAGLVSYTPEGLALLRYLIASLCMVIFYWQLPKRSRISFRDGLAMLLVGAVGIALYNITLNYGELTVSSSISSFVVSLAPILTAFMAFLFLNEKMTFVRFMGFIVSFVGISIIAIAETHQSSAIDMGLVYLSLATFIGACYSLLQKAFLKKYHPIEATSFIIWGGTIVLLVYFPELLYDTKVASWQDTAMVIYLGVFPGAIGYLAWGYVLSKISAVQAGSYLYYMPFFATLIGWFYLGELPIMLSVLGGIVAIVGVWLVDYSYRLAMRQKRTTVKISQDPIL